MHDWEAAAERLLEHTSCGVDKYVFYLQDTQPYGHGVFHWYSSEQELLNAITQDLYGDRGAQEDDEIEEFLDASSSTS